MNTPFEGWTDLRAIDGLRFDIRYHGPDNFTGAQLPGYAEPGAWLLGEAATSLQAIVTELEAQGLALLIYDAYRPRRGTLAMVAWAERTAQENLLDEGYIARTSSHNRGNALDLTLVAVASGEPLDMGTPWDSFSEASHTENASGAVLENRRRLVEVMHRHGWKNFKKEWWHFNYSMKSSPLRDRPYGPNEAPEGDWTAPSGWNQPGWSPPNP